MTETAHAQLGQLLRQTGPKAAVWLIHGEEMLVEKSVRQVRDALLGDADPGLHYEVVDGLAENIPDLLETLNTFSLLGGVKLVHFKEAGIFDARGRQAQLASRIQQAWQGDQSTKAARALWSLLGQAGIDPGQDGTARDIREPAVVSLVESLGAEAVDAMLRIGRQQGWTNAVKDDQVEVLRTAIEKGFPSGHLLVISASSKVAKNLKFYKTAAKAGVVVDCGVPQSERRADKQARETLLRQALQEMLDAAGKRVAPGLFDRLAQLTGFDLRTFTDNIAKLIAYCGPRPEITAEDIQAVLKRTKQDPIFELTNAVADRNLVDALFYLDSLLATAFHPLQMLAALTNQIRKLLVAKDFCESDPGRVWSAGMPYHQFQQQVMPVIQAYDEQVVARSREWSAAHPSIPAKEVTDLRLVTNPNNAYPVFQTLLKCVKFTRGELVRGLTLLRGADVGMKTSAQDPVLILKKAVGDICRLPRG